MTEHDTTTPSQGLPHLDRLIHEPARLAVVTVLSVRDGADFTFLANAAQLSRGNLSAHLSTLERAGIVAITKGFVGKRPQTWVTLTDHGREAVRSYWEHLDAWRRHLETGIDGPAAAGDRPQRG